MNQINYFALQMKRILYIYISLTLVIAYTSCINQFKVTHKKTTNMVVKEDQQISGDSSIIQLISPYKNKLDVLMNEVIGRTNTDLVKAMPLAGLGNMAADACLTGAQKHTSTPVDFAVLNSGGIRIPSINKGAITVGQIYELMPFDNQIVVVELKGADCELLFEWITKWKGAPVSKLNMKIDSGKYSAVFINGEPFDKNKTYRVATTDFIANGGDGATFFANGKTIATSYKLRDAIIAYIRTIGELTTNYNERITDNEKKRMD